MKPLKYFYLMAAILSIAIAVLSFYKEYPEAGMVYALNAIWTFVGYRWYSLCDKQRELINKIIDHYGRY